MLGWELPPHINGGMGVVCYEMSKVLARHGATIDFVLPYTASHPEAESFMNVIGASPQKPLITGGFGAYSDWTERSVEFDAITDEYEQTALKQAKLFPPDVIHAHDWLTLRTGVKLKQATKRPLIAHVHATEFDRAGGKNGNPLIHEIEHMGLMMADRVIAISNYTKQLLMREYHIPESKIEIIHNTINYDDFADIETGDSYRYISRMKQEGYYVVGAVGRLTVQKGYTHLIRAMGMASKRLSRLILVIGSSGELRDELLELSAEQGVADRVILPGWVSGNTLHDIFSLSDAFVMSSVSEPFGITPLEAAAHGSAVVVTKQTGSGEILRHSIKYDYWDEQRLADILINLATSPSLTTHLQESAANEVRTMNWGNIAHRYIEQYKRLGASA